MGIHIPITIFFQDRLPNVLREAAIFTQKRLHEQNINCSQTKLDDIAHEQTISCRQLIAGHVIGSWPMKRKKNLDQMITNIMLHSVVRAGVKENYLLDMSCSYTGFSRGLYCNGQKFHWRTVGSRHLQKPSCPNRNLLKEQRIKNITTKGN